MVEHVRLIVEVEVAYPIILCPDGGVMDGDAPSRPGSARGGRDAIRAVRLPALPEPDFHNCTPEDLPD